MCAGELVSVPRSGLFQELVSVPPQELETVPPLGGPFSHYKVGFFEDFCGSAWCQLVFLCFLALAQLVTSVVIFSIFPKGFLPLFKKPFLDK